MQPIAFVVDEPGKGSLREIGADPVGAGDLLCRTIYVGICGSDRRLWRGEMPASHYPRIPGHEIVAQVVTSRHKTVSDGEIIAVNPYHNCGTCYACLAGKPNACVNNETFGVQRNGLLRDEFVIPASSALPLPVTAATAQPYWSLIEPLSLVIHAATRAQYVIGSWGSYDDKHIIIGGGNLGKLTSAYLTSQGLKVIVASDDARHDNIQSNCEIVPRVEFAAIYDNSAPIVYVVGDKPDDMSLALSAVVHGGVIVVLSHGTVGKPSGILQKDLVFKEVALVGSRNATKRDFLSAIALLRHGGSKHFSSIIEHSYEFTDTAITNALADRSYKSVIKF